MSDKEKALLLIFLEALLSAGNGPVQKIGLFSIPPLTFAFVRFLLSSFVILPFFFQKRKKAWSEIKALSPMTAFASLNIMVFILGLRLTTASIAQLLYAATPLLSGVIAFRLLGDKLTTRKLMGIVIGFMGIVIVVLLPVLERGGQFSGNLEGNLLIIIGVVCTSVYMVLSKKAQQKHSPVAINNTFIILTTILLFPLFLLELIITPGWWTNVTLTGLSALLYTVVFGTIALWLVKQYAVKHGGVLIASLSMYLTPISTFILAYLLLGEKLTSGIIIGGVLALVGIFLTSR